jgi:hypothetical protein
VASGPSWQTNAECLLTLLSNHRCSASPIRFSPLLHHLSPTSCPSPTTSFPLLIVDSRFPSVRKTSGQTALLLVTVPQPLDRLSIPIPGSYPHQPTSSPASPLPDPRSLYPVTHRSSYTCTDTITLSFTPLAAFRPQHRSPAPPPNPFPFRCTQQEAKYNWLGH